MSGGGSSSTSNRSTVGGTFLAGGGGSFGAQQGGSVQMNGGGGGASGGGSLNGTQGASGASVIGRQNVQGQGPLVNTVKTVTTISGAGQLNDQLKNLLSNISG